MAGLKVKVSGAWKNVPSVYVKVSGAWKNCQNVFVKVSGAWKPMYSYSYSVGGWGGCSKTCGGGTQTRTVTCKRNFNGTSINVADSYCTKAGVSKPATSQSCNTQACTECHAYEAEKYSWKKRRVLNIGSCSFIIYWNSAQVYTVTGDECQELDSSLPRTIGGYTYTKYDTGAEYMGVCRTPA